MKKIYLIFAISLIITGALFAVSNQQKTIGPALIATPNTPVRPQENPTAARAIQPAPAKPATATLPAKTPAQTTAATQTPVPTQVNIATAPTPYPGCVQMDAAENNLSEPRINLVFVGVNYASRNDFAEAVKLATDAHAEKDGLFSVEPFLSNRNKFNILYTTAIVSLPEEQSVVPVNTETYNTLKNSVSVCDYQNRFGFVLVNTSKNLRATNVGEVRGSANIFAYPEHGSISTFQYPPQSTNALRGAQRLLVHEGGGHNIGNLIDEYVTPTWLANPTTLGAEFKSQCYTVAPSSLSCQLNYGNYTCNFATNPTAESTCALDAPWRDLIGNGCGQDGVIDCTDRDQDYRKEVRCWTNKCSVNSFGSVSGDNIMSVSSGGGGIIMADEFTRKPFFGAQDERLICRRIKDMTGSIGGICNSLCLSGCPSGQYCSAGTCHSR